MSKKKLWMVFDEFESLKVVKMYKNGIVWDTLEMTQAGKILYKLQQQHYT